MTTPQRLATRARELGARLNGWRRTTDGKTLLALLAAALLIRLVLAPFHGFFHDLQAYVTWGRLLDHHFLHFYTVASTTDVVNATRYGYLPNYPPLTVYIFGLLDGVYALAAHAVGVHTSYNVSLSPALAVYMRLPALAADLATVALIYRLARRRWSLRASALLAAGYAFSPAILFDGALWGQTDSVFTLAVIAALLCAYQGRGVWAGVLIALAITLKPQPVIFTPLIPLYLLRWSGWREALRSVGGMVAAGAVICAPYLIPPHPQILVFTNVAQQVALAKPWATLDAMNLWWMLGIIRQPETAPVLGSLAPATIGIALFAALFALVLVGVWRDRSLERLFLGAGIIATAFFSVTTLQHERYLFPAMALFLFAALDNRRHLLPYALATLVSFLNMAMAVLINANPPDGFPADPGINLNREQIYFIHHGLPTLIVAAIDLWMLALAMILYLRSLPRPAAVPLRAWLSARLSPVLSRGE